MINNQTHALRETIVTEASSTRNNLINAKSFRRIAITSSPWTYFPGLFILRQHLVSFFLSFFFLQLLSGQRVTVIVSGQQAEVAIFLRVEVEPRKLWKKNRVMILGMDTFCSCNSSYSHP